VNVSECESERVLSKLGNCEQAGGIVDGLGVRVTNLSGIFYEELWNHSVQGIIKMSCPCTSCR
jgi:hypothetical protein